MDSQVAQPKDIVRQLIKLAIAAILSLLACGLGFYILQRSNPFVQSVLSLQGDSVKGEEIFAINCAGCHGIAADGVVGPSLHKVSHHRSSMSLIHQVIDGQTPPMPKFQPNSQEMADLLSYLETL